MNCLILAATAKEISPFLDHYQKAGIADIDILITGIGLTASTYALTRQIQLKRPSFVLQAGIAGSFDKTLALGSVLGIRKEAFADQAVIEQGQLKNMFDLGLADPDRPPFKKGWLLNPGNYLTCNSKLKMVTGISINEITSSEETIQMYSKKYRAATESMEGAALHYVCLMEKIPFLQLRSISNYIGERNKQRWKMKEAIANLNKELVRLVKLI